MRKFSFVALLLALVFTVSQVCVWAGENPEITDPEAIVLQDAEGELTEDPEIIPEDTTVPEAADAAEDGEDAAPETADPAEMIPEDPAVEEPVIEEPIIEEPAIEEPVIEEPTAEILTEEVTTEEVIIEEPAEETAAQETEAMEQDPAPQPQESAAEEALQESEEDLTIAEVIEEVTEAVQPAEEDEELQLTEETEEAAQESKAAEKEEETKEEKAEEEKEETKANASKPGTPVLSSIKSVDGGLKISWKSVKGAKGYNVYFWHATKKKYVKFATTKSTSYIDTGAKAGKRYYYTVSAYNDEGEGSYDYDGILGAYTPATKVTSLKNEENGLTLKWTAVDSASGYYIYYRRDNGKWKYWKEVGSDVTSLTKINGTTGVLYEYMVIPFVTIKGTSFQGAYNSASSKSVVFVATPKLQSAEAAAMGVMLKWDAVPGAKGYKIYWWHETKKKYVEFASTTATNYVDTTAKQGKRYWYTVAAYVGDTTGAYDYDGIEGLYLPGAVVTSLKCTGEGVKLTWNPVSKATGYRIYWRYTNKTKWKVWQDVYTTSVTDDKVKANTGYEYCVVPFTTVNGKKFLGYDDNAASYAILKGIPATPKLKKAEYASNGVTLTWEPVTGATKYNLYWKPLQGNADWKYFASTTSTTFLDTTAAGDPGYYYTVQAENQNGPGMYDKKGIKGAPSDVETMAREKLKAVGNTLRAAYDWSVKINYTRNFTGNTTSQSALYAYNNNAGDCIAKASSFYWMAKMLGYTDIRVIMGQVPYANGGYGDHAWVEIDQNGETFVCDPDFEWDEGLNGYFIKYGQSGTWVYKYGYIMKDY